MEEGCTLTPHCRCVGYWASQDRGISDREEEVEPEIPSVVLRVLLKVLLVLTRVLLVPVGALLVPVGALLVLLVQMKLFLVLEWALQVRGGVLLVLLVLLGSRLGEDLRAVGPSEG